MRCTQRWVSPEGRLVPKLMFFESLTPVKLSESLPAVAHARELSARLSATDKLLLERTIELRAAQAFLTRTDDISEAELVGMIESLNTLISSVSGALSDWDQRDPAPEILVREAGLEQIRHDFGNSTLEQIAARNRVAVTLAIQMHLGYFVERVTSGWGDGQAAEILSEIYGMISTRGRLDKCGHRSRADIHLHRKSGDRVKVENTDETLHAQSRTAPDGGDCRRSRSNPNGHSVFFRPFRSDGLRKNRRRDGN